MDKRTRTALEGSIAKWEAIVAGTGTDEGAENCPLCQLFFTRRGPQQLFCEGCPVKERTGQPCCEGSPYQEWSENPHASGDEAKRIAQAEVDFLRSLLPPEPDLATLLAEAKERGPMSDAERQAQRESWVREALEAVDNFMFNETPEQSAIWSKVRKALDALGAAPAEQALTEARPTFSADFNQHFGSYRAADVAVTCTGASVTIDVLAKNKAENLVITNFSNPANGSLVYNSGDKSFTYTPDDGFSGVDTFSYTVLDQKGATATAEVTIEVVGDGG